MYEQGGPESRGCKGYLAEVRTSMGDEYFEGVFMIVTKAEIINDIFTSFEDNG